MSDFCVYEISVESQLLKLNLEEGQQKDERSQDKDEYWWRACIRMASTISWLGIKTNIYCYLQLEDNVWDEFNESGDHIVPHPDDEFEDQFRAVGDNWKKPQLEIIGAASNVGDDLKFTQKKEENSFFTLTKKERMLDKGPWSCASDDVFPTCGDGSVKEVTSIASEETKLSNHCLKSGKTDSAGSEFGAADPILGEKSTADNTDTYLSLDQISQTDSDLNFFNNDREGKENSDLLYYEWPDDIGNFEDVDRMFRSCDATFGFGSLSNEDDLCWFSSHATEGSEDAAKLGPKFSSSEGNALYCLSDHNETPSLNNADHSVIDANKKSLLISDKISSNANVAENSGSGHLQSNGSDARSVSKDDLMLKEQIMSHKSQARHRNHSEGKRKERNLANGGFFHHSGNCRAQSSLGDPCHHVFSPPGLQQRKQSIGSDSLNYMQTNTPFMHIDYGHSSDQTSVSARQSGIGSECSGLPSPFPKDSSFASNQVQSMESSQDPLLEAPVITNGNSEKLYHQEDLQSCYSKNFKCATIASPAAFYDSVQNQTPQSEYEVEGQSEIEAVSMKIPAELDSSNGQESSCMSSVLNEISLEASSFRQLQEVMEQLDIRTKLCIRDSLYRLARSAEQRHNCVNANTGKRDGQDKSQSMAEEINKGTAFLDMETDTNPIDRSIAHLLFHRPSDPSAMPTNDALPLQPHTMVHGSITGPRVMAKEQVCQQKTANVADKSLLMSGKKS